MKDDALIAIMAAILYAPPKNYPYNPEPRQAAIDDARQILQLVRQKGAQTP